MSHARTFMPRKSLAPSRGAARDYRELVDAVQAADLPAARSAYGWMMERLSSAGTGSDDALARIGEALRRGDLATAQRVLSGLEGKALQVLGGLRDHPAFLRFERSSEPPSRKPN